VVTAKRGAAGGPGGDRAAGQAETATRDAADPDDQDTRWSLATMMSLDRAVSHALALARSVGWGEPWAVWDKLDCVELVWRWTCEETGRTHIVSVLCTSHGRYSVCAETRFQQASASTTSPLRDELTADDLRKVEGESWKG
jgi:hypothetical protein